MWVSGGLWLGVLLVDWWLLGRSHDEGSTFENAWDIAALVSTVAWGAALGGKGAWRWAIASVAVGAVWSNLWGAVAYYSDPDPQGESVLLVPMILLTMVEFALLIGLGAGGGALYRRMRARRVPRA
jgi:hypothetical protein